MTSIQIERLKEATRVYHKGGDFGSGDFAEVQSVEFDGHGYMVSALFIESNGATDWAGETEVQFYVDAGESVMFGGRGEPALRDAADVSRDEWEAKIEANDAAIDALISEANAKCADIRRLNAKGPETDGQWVAA